MTFFTRSLPLRLGRLLPVFALAAVALAGTAKPATAQVDLGLRAGVSIDPDQGYFGVHGETSPLVERLRFRPNAEVGFGNDLTLLALNFEFVWKFPESRSGWVAYAGAGPAINVFFFESRGDDDAEMEPGLNFVGGLEARGGLFFEFKVGALDSPDLKIGIGYTWR